MLLTIGSVELPEVLKPYAAEFNALFPDKVEYDAETRGITLKEPGSFGFQVTSAFIGLAAEIDDVTSNLNIVLKDLGMLVSRPPIEPGDGERRYVLLTKLFFYELLRIRDALPRFLSEMESLNVMEKKERHETRKLLERQLSEHYLIRNAYLHGHTIPRSDKEADLKFIATLSESGYAPELHPRDGSPAKLYPQLLVELASERIVALQKIGTDVVTFVQNVMAYGAVWIAHHKLQVDASDNLSA